MSTSPDAEKTSSTPHKSNSLVIAIVAIVTVLVLGAIVFYVFGFAAIVGARQLETATLNAQGMGSAVESHQKTYMRLPFNTVDGDGNPLVSWRHQLLSFMGQQQVTDYINPSVAWDDPSHSEGAGKNVPPLMSPRGKNQGDAIAHFVCVTDETSPMSGAKVTLNDVEARDGKANTALFLEYVDSDIKWAEPRDLSLSQAIEAVQSNPSGKTVVLLADGKVIFVPASATNGELEKLFLLDNGAPAATWMKR